jgi:hypothetical protein
VEERIAHLKGLLARLEAANARLATVPDATEAADVLAEINEIAHEISTEVERQRRAVAEDDGPDGQLGLL